MAIVVLVIILAYDTYSAGVATLHHLIHHGGFARARAARNANYQLWATKLNLVILFHYILIICGHLTHCIADLLRLNIYAMSVGVDDQRRCNKVAHGGWR